MPIPDINDLIGDRWNARNFALSVLAHHSPSTASCMHGVIFDTALRAYGASVAAQMIATVIAPSIRGQYGRTLTCAQQSQRYQFNRALVTVASLPGLAFELVRDHNRLVDTKTALSVEAREKLRICCPIIPVPTMKRFSISLGKEISELHIAHLGCVNGWTKKIWDLMYPWAHNQLEYCSITTIGSRHRSRGLMMRT
ncbi:hypothetical protein BDZ89DRAFT_1157226 [Hymenopellis radicata]|nr:hypothetical protein BDZ89DRAFT_1157226 [Hymenopellis radicata]